jgi:hypothetical protein
MLWSEPCLVSCQQSPRLPHFRFGYQRGTLLYLIMRHTIDVFIVNDTIDLPFLLVICHFNHLLRYSRVIQSRFHQCSLWKSGRLAIYGCYRLLGCCSCWNCWSCWSRCHARRMGPIIFLALQCVRLKAPHWTGYSSEVRRD